MKKLIKSIYLVLFGVLALSVSSCTDDYEYDAAKAEGEQVYFSNTLSSTVEISPSSTSFTIPVRRINTSDAITVPITSTVTDGSIFNVGSEVSFAEGDSVAYLTITYDTADIEYGRYDTISLAIADADYTTPYGSSTYEFTAGVTAWTDPVAYNSAGTCSFIYSQFYSGTDSGLGFLVSHNTISTNLYRFTIEDCLGGIDLVLDYDSSTGYVTCDPQYIGYTSSSYGQVYVTDYNNYVTSVRGQELSEPVYGEFDADQGIIAIPLVYYVSAGYFGMGYEYIYLDGYDRADYSCSVTYSGKFTDSSDNTSIVADVTLGSDVDSARVAVVSGSLDQTGLNSVIAGTASPMTTLTASGTAYLDASSLTSGSYTIVVVTYGDGEAQNYATATFRYTSGTAETWNALYLGTYAFGASALTSNASSIFEGSQEAVLYQSASDESKYKIAPWTDTDGTYPLEFTVDDNQAIHFDCETGQYYNNTSMISFTDIDTYSDGQYASYIGTWDTSTNVLNFVGAYNCSEGYFGYVGETFTISGSASSKSARVKAFSKARNLKRNSGLKAVRQIAHHKISTVPSLYR